MNIDEFKNKRKSYLFYFPECNGKCRRGWCLHHKDPSWKTEDPVRYAEWRIEDLEPMTVQEHHRLHALGNTNMLGKKRSEETKKKIGAKHQGNKNALGKHWNLTEETKQKLSVLKKGTKISEEGRKTMSKAWHSSEAAQTHLDEVHKSLIGSHWYNNGIKEVFCKECPEGFAKGRLSK